MKKKIKGSQGERELFHKFWDIGWACVRAAGSGSTRMPSPDLIAGNGKKKIVIEVKVVNSNKKYLAKKEIEELNFFGKQFGAEPFVAIKFQGVDWYLISTEELEKRKKTYYVDLHLANKKGLKFDEFIEFSK